MTSTATKIPPSPDANLEARRKSNWREAIRIMECEDRTAVPATPGLWAVVDYPITDSLNEDGSFPTTDQLIQMALAGDADYCRVTGWVYHPCSRESMAGFGHHVVLTDRGPFHSESVIVGEDKAALADRLAQATIIYVHADSKWWDKYGDKAA